MSLIYAVPPAIVDMNQKGLLERALYEGLYPYLGYRMEATREEWPPNSGQEIVMSRAGILKPVVVPNTPGVDPTPQNEPYEQWVANLQQFSTTTDANMPTSATANVSIFYSKIKELGKSAGRSINFLARNALFKPYLSGRTSLTAATATSDTTIKVASLNGFTTVLLPFANQVNSSARPQPVSPSTPLPITIQHTTPVSRNVIGYQPDNPLDPFGPGTLYLDATVGVVIPTRTPVASANAVDIYRSSGGSGVDSITSNDTLSLQLIINAVSRLRFHNVPPHDDGFYHAHISSLANSQLFADPVFQRLNQSLPEGAIYKQGFIGHMHQVMFFMNTESPNQYNVGNLVSTGTKAKYGEYIGADVINETGVQIGRMVITGKSALYERMFDESNLVSEAGVNGKIGEFDIMMNNMQVSTEGIRLIIRAPLDRLQQVVSLSYSFSTAFAAPSDLTAPTGPQLYKRAAVLEYAENI
jgi:hypothetical protein